MPSPGAKLKNPSRQAAEDSQGYRPGLITEEKAARHRKAQRDYRARHLSFPTLARDTSEEPSVGTVASPTPDERIACDALADLAKGGHRADAGSHSAHSQSSTVLSAPTKVSTARLPPGLAPLTRRQVISVGNTGAVGYLTRVQFAQMRVALINRTPPLPTTQEQRSRWAEPLPRGFDRAEALDDARFAALYDWRHKVAKLFCEEDEREHGREEEFNLPGGHEPFVGHPYHRDVGSSTFLSNRMQIHCPHPIPYVHSKFPQSWSNCRHRTWEKLESGSKSALASALVSGLSEASRIVSPSIEPWSNAVSPSVCENCCSTIATHPRITIWPQAIDWVEGKLTGPPSADMLRWLGVNIVPEPEKKPAIASQPEISKLRSAADKTTPDYIDPPSEKDLQNRERVRKEALQELDRL
ncbi:hypothetical protein C8F04DRAFT_1194485 [Mycena alexandri]|uniref:Uncharacterized protein n=1 Tax=Mycena alexandri TaxID=1745969 RepID=A0AAD6S8S3_9AGAR|nr:hypothetical protein C8F04DRAFT_1194485 [Mycena alexandri]